MGWAVGFDHANNRDIGYGVPATCDHPECDKKIDRGLAYVCGGDVYGGEDGCGLFFCYEHLVYATRTTPEGEEEHSPQLCEVCAEHWSVEYDNPDQHSLPAHFDPKPDHPEWIEHKLTCPSWEDWRKENPKFVAEHS